jgi:tetratricopeptide (TPR) repeat protein
MQPSNPQAPQIIAGRYVIERLLDKGGMGLVFVARDLQVNDRRVALKMLKPGHGPVSIERFRREAQAISELSHQNIVTLLDTGLDGTEPYIVQELLEGRTLRTLLEERPDLPLREAIGLGLQCARGLSAAHAKGIVHRDLKPENLFVTEHGQLKILDFGIAKMMPAAGSTPNRTASDSGDGHVTKLGQVLGTNGYMSPEQILGSVVELPGDIFLLGLVLHELVSGKRAFKRGSNFETSSAIVSAEPEKLKSWLPLRLREVIKRCLRKEAAARPRVEEVIRVLETVLRTASSADLAAPGGVSRRWILRPRQRAGGALLLAVAAMAVIVYWLWPSPPLAPPGKRTIAVLPFAVSGGPTTGLRGEELVRQLGDGLAYGDVRVVDVESMQRFVDSRKGVAGDEVARSFQAVNFVTGSLTEHDNLLTVVAALRRPGVAEPLIEVTVDGTIPELLRMVNTLCMQFAPKLGIVELPSGPAGRLARLARISTSRPEAALAYWRGEAALRRDDRTAALDLFQLAVNLDPDFALAQYRLALTASMLDPAVAARALKAALAGRQHLAARDSALVDALAAFQAGRLDEANRRYKEITDENVDDVDAWYLWGDALFHLNPLHGRPSSEADRAFTKVLLYDPNHGGALVHMLDLAQLELQRGPLADYADRWLPLGRHKQLDKLPVRWSRAWAKSDVVERKAVLDEAADAKTDFDALDRTIIRALWQRDDLNDAARLAGLATGRSDPPIDRAAGLDRSAIVDLALGRPKAARLKLAQAAAAMPGYPHDYERLWPSTLEFVQVDDDTLHADLAAASALPVTSPESALAKVYLQGALAARLRDESLAGGAADMLMHGSEGEGSVARDLARAIRARLADARGDTAAAAKELSGMELQVPYKIAHLFPRIAEPLLRMKLFPQDAGAIAGSFAFADRRAAVYFAPMALLRGQQLEAAGKRDEALREYQRYLQLRADPDPGLRAEVDGVREKVRLLSGP